MRRFLLVWFASISLLVFGQSGGANGAYHLSNLNTFDDAAKDTLFGGTNFDMFFATDVNEMPDRKLQRDLEIFARAEKRMLINVPGFAPAWENAKHAAHTEIEDEESGKSVSKRVFAKFFAAPGKDDKTLPSTEQPSAPEI